MTDAGVELYWLPLGAGGWFVRLNGRIYESLVALIERRPKADLYHAALFVERSEGRFVIESAPVVDDLGALRGVVASGPVGSRVVGALRVFRYEVRCWRSGTIPDIDEAVESPRRLSQDAQQAQRILSAIREVPCLTWGRDELGVGDMWNSNSVISWALMQADLPADRIRPPAGGRAPGWAAGVEAARRPELLP